ISLLDQREAIAPTSLADDDAQGWEALKTRSDVLLDSGRPEDVRRLLEPLRDRLLARHDAAAITCLMNLGDAFTTFGNEEEGLSLLRQARQLAESEKGLPPELLILASISEAGNLIDTMRFTEGKARAEATLAIWHEQGDPPNRDVIEVYRAIALGSEAVGDIARAETAYQQSIALAERFFDKPNTTSAWNLEAYGTFLIAQGRPDEAEPYVMRSLKMHREVLPEDDHRVLYSVAAMGKLRAAQHNYVDSANWFTQGIETCAVRERKDKNQVCARLFALRARAYAMEKRFADAQRDIDEAEHRQIALSGDGSTGHAYILDVRVVVEAMQHRYAEAVATADRTLAIYRQAKGGLIQSQLSTRYWRALALHELHRNDEALGEVLDIEPQYAALFPHGRLRLDILALKARVLEDAKRFDEARAAAASALSTDQAPEQLEPDVVAELRRIAGVRHSS
ncbi:MAG TPA: tetratricopeptide repeat protein, partial [Rhodanobacteraceae bacterium]